MSDVDKSMEKVPVFSGDSITSPTMIDNRTTKQPNDAYVAD